MRASVLCLLVALATPSVARAQIDAVLEGAAGAAIARCHEDAAAACDLALPNGIAPGWYRVRTNVDGVSIEGLVAARGLEIRMHVEQHDGALHVDRVAPFPATLAMRMLTGGRQSPYAVPMFWVESAVPVALGPAWWPRNFLYVEIAHIAADGRAWRLPREYRCGNAVTRDDWQLSAGHGALAYSAIPTGSHAAIHARERYRTELCVQPANDAWWEESADPLSMIPPATSVATTDMLCAVDKWMGQDLLDAITAPPLPPPDTGPR